VCKYLDCKITVGQKLLILSPDLSGSEHCAFVGHRYGVLGIKLVFSINLEKTIKGVLS
jgi:hypothetical protein